MIIKFFISPTKNLFLERSENPNSEYFFEVTEELFEEKFKLFSSGYEFSNSNPDDPLELVERRVTLEELKERFLTLVQTMMDTKARSYGYDNINSAVSYAEEPSVITYQQEGKAFRSWRSLVWLKCNTLLAEVVAGEREIPTEQELLDSLPSLVI